MKYLILFIFDCYICLYSTAQQSVDSVLEGTKKLITLTLLQPTADKINQIGFGMKAYWMDGTIEMRFPETLQSQEGLYFIDHYRPDMLPLSQMLVYPEWIKK